MEKPEKLPAPSPEAAASPAREIHLRVDEVLRQQIRTRIGRLVTDPDEAEDLTQETLLRVVRGLPRFRGESSLKTWALRIAGHVVIDRHRQAASRPADQSGPPPGGQIEDLEPSREPGPADDLERSVSVACLRGALSALPESYRQVFELHDLGGFADGEIAEMLHLPLSTVKMRLHRARRRLRSACEARCQVYRSERGDVACCPTSENSL